MSSTMYVTAQMLAVCYSLLAWLVTTVRAFCTSLVPYVVPCRLPTSDRRQSRMHHQALYTMMHHVIYDTLNSKT